MSALLHLRAHQTPAPHSQLLLKSVATYHQSALAIALYRRKEAFVQMETELDVFTNPLKGMLAEAFA
jgi:hypothetical protein